MKKTPTLIIAGLSLAALGATQVAPYLLPTGVTPGAYTSANITVNEFGQITVAANGTGGGGTNGGDVYTSSNNVFTGLNQFSASLQISNTASAPVLYIAGTNSVGANVQHGYLRMAEYSFTPDSNLELASAASGGTNAPNLRLTAAGWQNTGDYTNIHVGVNIGGSTNSVFTIKRNANGDGYVQLRNNARMNGGNVTNEADIAMTSDGLTIQPKTRNLLLEPVAGVTRMTGATTPSYPSSGEGVEIAYDSDETSYGGAGLATFSGYDRGGAAWATVRIKGNQVILGGIASNTNLVISDTNAVFNVPAAFGSLTIGTLTIQTNATIPNTTLTNGVAFGQSTLSAHSAGTNFVVDPTVNQYQLITVNNTNAVRFLHLTNGAPGRQTVVLINVQTNTTVSVALGANQFASTTNLMSLTQGQILPLSFYCYGSNNTNVVVSVPTIPFIHR